jgi:tRNA 2-thiouridine synthesizing protein A
MVEVDVRGLSCPIPVVRVREAIEASPGEELSVLADSEVVVENVSRMATSRGFTATVEETGDDYRIRLTPAS